MGLIRRVGGNSPNEPSGFERRAGKGARALVEKSLEGIDPERLLDYHVHVVGLGVGGTGAFVNPKLRSWGHPLERLKFSVYASAAGITDMEQADRQFVERLVSLGRASERHGRYLIMAFDKYHRPDGTPNLEKTEFYTPNEYVHKLAAEFPDVFVPACSINPYRPDALEALDRWAEAGTRMVKWLPNAMGIDPADERCDRFYEKMKAHDMVLLCHAGEEKAVEAEEDQKLGNPLRLRKPLGMGIKVIVAHCASLGKNEDLDRDDRRLCDNFDLFMRLMDDDRYDGLVFGDISATTQFNRLPRPLLTLLGRKDLHHRLVNGTDYPLPAINIIIRTRGLAKLGLIAGAERAALNEIYSYNPMLFDFVVKRTLRSPEGGHRFPPALFMVHPELEPFHDPPRA